MLSDITLKYIAGSLRINSSRLEVLKLGSNQFSDKEGARFADALRHNDKLRKVDLSNNNLTDESATHLLHVMRRITHVTSLKLDRNMISPKIVEQVD